MESSKKTKRWWKSGRREANLLGMSFGNLTVKEKLENRNGRTRWLCVCSCGAEKITMGIYLTTGDATSCGCKLKERQQKASKKRKGDFQTAKGEGSALTNVLHGYRKRAKQLKVAFNLNKEEFEELVKARCHYCGRSPRTTSVFKYKSGTSVSITRNGIDRKNSELGYDLANSVSCCITCNKAKGTMSYEEFINYLKDLTDFRNKLCL